MLPATASSKRGRKGAVEEVEPPPPPPPPPPTLSAPLFPPALPVDVGPLPQGLANVSAQGCHACHPDIHDAWSSSPHAGPPSVVLLDAAASDPLCLGCHLPLLPQHDVVPTLQVAGADPAPAAPNPTWDGGLTLEGVTCAACHVREGRVAVSTEDAARREGPHPVALAAGLDGAKACAACHQATWPGADLPLYDTWGEWERSPWAAAGATCLDCHGDGTGHLRAPDPARAFSLLVRPSHRRLVRGPDEVLRVAIDLQNTGAGHAMPTGTPFRGLRLHARLEGPPAKRDAPPTISGEPLIVDLMRTLEPTPPWRTTDDTRIQAGETRSFTLEVPIVDNLSAGSWTLVVELLPTLRGGPDGAPIISTRLPLALE